MEEERIEEYEDMLTFLASMCEKDYDYTCIKRAAELNFDPSEKLSQRRLCQLYNTVGLHHDHKNKSYYLYRFPIIKTAFGKYRRPSDSQLEKINMDSLITVVDYKSTTRGLIYGVGSWISNDVYCGVGLCAHVFDRMILRNEAYINREAAIKRVVSYLSEVKVHHGKEDQLTMFLSKGGALLGKGTRVSSMDTSDKDPIFIISILKTYVSEDMLSKYQKKCREGARQLSFTNFKRNPVEVKKFFRT